MLLYGAWPVCAILFQLAGFRISAPFFLCLTITRISLSDWLHPPSSFPFFVFLNRISLSCQALFRDSLEAENNRQYLWSLDSKYQQYYPPLCWCDFCDYVFASQWRKLRPACIEFYINTIQEYQSNLSKNIFAGCCLLHKLIQRSIHCIFTHLHFFL